MLSIYNSVIQKKVVPSSCFHINLLFNAALVQKFMTQHTVNTEVFKFFKIFKTEFSKHLWNGIKL